MEYNFDLRRILLFAAILSVFALLGGFSFPELASDSLYQGARIRKAWVYCCILVIVGATLASFIDHWAGMMEPKNYRSLYIILGLLLILAGGLWQHSLKQTVEAPASAAAIVSTRYSIA